MKESESLITIGATTFLLVSSEDGTYTSTPVQESEGVALSPLTVTLAEFESTSSPGQKHYVKYGKEAGLYCTCWGFTRHHHCWHVDEVAKQLKEKLNATSV